MIVQRREFANYLRENSGVKDHSTSSEIIVWFAVCAGDSSPRVLNGAHEHVRQVRFRSIVCATVRWRCSKRLAFQTLSRARLSATRAPRFLA